MKKYNHKKIEAKWQRRWEKEKLYQAKDFDKKPKFYCLDMFPYPSAEGLHVGHPEGYTATDIVTRYLTMKGYNVLHPMGFDAFGLPAENYALKTGIHPALQTAKNIKKIKQQIKSLGFAYDWSREINTTNPKYYKWTQWIFLQLFKHGLAYEATVPINWCPSCKTGLANEEVVGGKCERCGTQTIRKDMKQWMLKITAYADRLLKDLDDLDWEERIKEMQRNWIGRSEGAEVRFEVKSQKSKVKNEFIKIFTTRPDTLFGCTYLVVAPEHPIISNLKSQISNLKEVEKYIKEARKKSDLERTELIKEKTGVELKGIKAINPVNGKEIPIWVADYVLISYGTGAIMAVPAHDTRDFEFARKFGLPMVEVVRPTQILHESNVNINTNKNANIASLPANCLIIHGSPRYDQSKEPGYVPHNIKHWLGWLKEKLEERGIKVFNPQMPLPWQPKYEDWKKIIEGLDIGKDSVLIGHSAGGAFLVRWLGEKKIKIKKLILVAPGKIPRSPDDRLRDFYNFEINSEIKNLAEEIIIFISNNDEEHRVKSAIIYQKELGAKLIELKNKGHFVTKDMGTREFPELLEAILPPPPTPPQAGGENLLPPPAFSFYRSYEPAGGEISQAYTGEGILINSEQFNGRPSEKAKWEITEWLAKEGLARKAVNYKLRDWVFSRQRYWGEPIPLVYCPHCEDEIKNKKLKIKNKKFSKGELLNPGWIALSEKELPLKLPAVKKYQPTGTGESPLAGIKKWVKVKCPKCGGRARRETNTMPQWAGSSWYWLRFIDPKNSKELADKKKLNYWLAVDLYVGGAEHAVLHLLYARFWNKFLCDIGVVPKIKFPSGKLSDEPFYKLRNQGMILGEDGEKMSKSRGNVINPNEIVNKYGADTMRIYEMFMGPFADAKPWSTKGIIGVRRFLERVWNLQGKVTSNKYKVVSELERLVHKTIKKVTEDIENFRFNTAISALMILVNKIYEVKELPITTYQLLLTILSPFAPHLAEELWEQLNRVNPSRYPRKSTSIFKEKWPKYDPELIKEEEIELIVQVNGKLRDRIKVSLEASEEEIRKLVLASEKIKKWLGSKELKKIIYVKGRLMNIVV